MDGLERVRSGRHASRNMSRRSMSRSSWSVEDMFAGSKNSRVDEDEEALKWAAIEKLPTYDRLRTSVIQSFMENEHRQNKQNGVVDVTKMDFADRQKFIDRIFKVAEEDNQKFLEKFRNRIDRYAQLVPSPHKLFSGTEFYEHGVCLIKKDINELLFGSQWDFQDTNALRLRALLL